MLPHRIDTRRRVNLESGSRSGTPAAQSVNAIDPASGSFAWRNAFTSKAGGECKMALIGSQTREPDQPSALKTSAMEAQ